ncbi:LysR family transcriptional regulator [Paracoccus shanxieyensis]|uniref:LysR family transcriptional regulator n=1 Tax=Paracoccus shanxieyensis TaxID=2675752 RepID=A0A6L6IYF6_9RHOB|nr:LysR family transcriptional regulator [Paracoccus shanxieyensis]MTH64302.1 LysR family transcriptional regulator [Paracoccus shanxieyensis]MTH87446.1 LysR family transcriptional regulator [Paracoccus shanxieyensis]
MRIGSENLNVNLRHVHAAHAIWRLGTFARAATELGVVPSALSETIRQIEEVIGAPIFDRSQRPPAPTPLGLDFLHDTAPLLEGFRLAIGRARAGAGLETGTLAVGAAPSAIGGLVGPALARFRARHPGIRCRLHDDIAEPLARMVVDGALDLAIAGRARQSPDIRHTLLTRDRFGLACNADHPLAAAGQVRLDQIDPAQIIALNDSTGTRQLLELSGKVPHDLIAGPLLADSTIAQLAMIRAGLGVGLLPENAVNLFGDPRIRFVALADLDLWRSTYLMEPARRAQSHIARAFVAELQP